MKIVAVIPARLKSKRFPNKLLCNFMGKPIISHVIENTLKFDFVDKVVVATENKEIDDFVRKNYSLDVVTITDCKCGTERVCKYSQIYNEYDYYMSVPSDEPCIDPNEINKIFKKIDLDDVVTFYCRFFCKEDLESELSCKIVSNYQDYMIYNSRSVIPVYKSGEYLSLNEYKKHVGIFIFPKNMGKEVWEFESSITDITGLEQNRFMDFGLRVKMYEIKHIGFGIDRPEQIEKLEKRYL